MTSRLEHFPISTKLDMNLRRRFNAMAAQPLYTIEEYLSFERAAEERHEYLDGYIYAMAGESPAHADISTNLVRIVSTQLLGSPCRVRTKDTKVRSGPNPKQVRSFKGLFSYP